MRGFHSKRSSIKFFDDCPACHARRAREERECLLAGNLRRSDVDARLLLAENAKMSVAAISEQLADLDALCANVGKPQDPELVKRVRERAREVRERIFREKGLLNVAVELIRETRDE